MKAIDLIIGVGWVVFWAYWLVMAATAKAGRSRWIQFAGVRVGIILVVLFLLRLRVFKGHGARRSASISGLLSPPSRAGTGRTD